MESGSPLLIDFASFAHFAVYFKLSHYRGPVPLFILGPCVIESEEIIEVLQTPAFLCRQTGRQKIKRPGGNSRRGTL